MGLSSRSRLLLLASHRMDLNRERKNSSRIAREINLFSNFAWSVPTLVRKHNSRFRVCRSTICWMQWSICDLKLLRNSLQTAFKQPSKFECVDFRRLLALDRQTLHRGEPWTLVYWNRTNWHFGFWEKKYWEIEFWPLGKESSPFCRTKWFHLQLKIAFFDLSVWLGWKFCSRPSFNFWQF